MLAGSPGTTSTLPPSFPTKAASSVPFSPDAAARANSTSGRPPRRSNCLGLPKRSPRPAATTIVQTVSALGQRVVEALLGLFLAHADGESELGHEDLAGPREHALLAGRQALV